MANSLPSLFILMLVSISTVSGITKTATSSSSVAKEQVPIPCTMCTECENPCQPLPPPPPPVIECPPPPPPPPPSPPPPPAIVECPPPPKPVSCPNNCESPPMPWTPPATPVPYYNYDNNSGGKMTHPSSYYSLYLTMHSLISVAFLLLPYY